MSSSENGPTPEELEGRKRRVEKRAGNGGLLGERKKASRIFQDHPRVKRNSTATKVESREMRGKVDWLDLLQVVRLFGRAGG